MDATMLKWRTAPHCQLLLTLLNATPLYFLQTPNFNFSMTSNFPFLRKLRSFFFTHLNDSSGWCKAAQGGC